MKYKRVLIFVTILLFVTVLIFASSMLFTVNEVEVKGETISTSNENVLTKAEEVVSSYKGKNYLFVKESEVRGAVEGSSPYVKVVSVKKSFPNKIVVEVKERREALALYYNSNYYVLDEDLTILKVTQNNANNIDGLKNVELVLNLADYGQAELSVGKTLNIYDNAAFNYVKESVSKFLENRQNLESVALEVKRDGIMYNRLTLTMREGVVFRIQKASDKLGAKLDKAFDYYSALTMPNGNKGEGEYFVYVLESSGEVIVSKS
jgi:hypothetical protein